MSTQPQKLNLRGVLSETSRVIKSHTRHFLALTLLFLFPLSFSGAIYATLQPNPIFHHRHLAIFSSFTTTITTTTSPPLNQSLLLLFIFSLFSYFFYLCAAGTITYTTIHGFNGKPVKIMSSLKSLLFSFLPLCATLILSIIFMCLVLFAVAILLAFVWKLFETVGVEIDHHSDYTFWVVVVVMIAIGVWFQVNWGLDLVVVVAESKWGYEPLRRSAYLIKGMRWVAFWMLVYFQFLLLPYTWGRWASANADSGRKSWALEVLKSACASVIMLYYLAANTVVYMYCKALHGELVLEIGEFAGGDYVSLPLDDGDAPHVVSVVHG